MSIVANFTVPSDQFALDSTLEAVPGASVEFERIVTHSQEWVMPFLWVESRNLDAFHREIRDDPTVKDATVTDEFEQVVLYRILWAEEIKRIVNAIFDRDGTLVEAVGSATSWEITVRFEDHDSLSELQSHFEECGPDFALQRLYTPTEPRQPEFRLTPEQRETLVLASERGYFDVPQQVTVGELADELEVSPTSASERLRRGMGNLVENTLTVGKRAALGEADDLDR